MNRAPRDLADFTHRSVHPTEETVLHTWDTRAANEFAVALTPPAEGRKAWSFTLPVRSNRATMLIVDLWLDCDPAPQPAVAHGYRTSFVVEWSGWNTLPFTLSSFTRVGEPTGFHAVRRLRLAAVSATFAGTVLDLGQPTWPGDAPVVAVTPYEDMIVNFLSEHMWDPADWVRSGTALLPAGEEAFDVAWMYANLRYRQRPGRRHRTAYTRRMNLDLTPYQAVTVFTATDIRAQFSVVLEIDGREVRAIDRRRGLGGGDEIRAPIQGRRLTALTFELEQAEDTIRETLDVQVASSIRWVLLERVGTDPAQVAQVTGRPPVPPAPPAEPLETSLLPIGILVGRDEFLQLRAAARQPGPLQKMADEMIAEAESHLAYEPERNVGRYLPVDLANQGCERRVSPANEMYHYNSGMVYGAVAYALTGDLRYGQAARRCLFSVLRCATWQAGFPSRIHCGLPGYRAPFVETDASEAVALAYDFLYPLLSPTERRDVEDTLYEKALPWIDMYLRLKGEGYLLSSNQGAVYTAGLAYAALVARRSHSDVDEVLERGIKWFPRMMGNYYKVNGATNEGPGYWEFTTKYAVSALLAISRHRGWNVRDYAPAHFGRTVDYVMHMRSLARDRLSFLPLGDNIESVGYHYMSSSLLFFARHYGDRNALWLWHEYYARRPNPPGSLAFGKRVAGTYTTSALMDFLLYVPDAPARPTLPPAKTFEVCDRVVLRTGSERGELLFLFEGGPQTFEHTHSDKGQFILEAFGERLAADPGVIRYQDPAHLFYKSTSYHNLVTLNGADQEYRDPHHAVVLDRVEFGAACDHILADLRNSYRAFSRYRRRIVFVRPYYFLVVDDVAATGPGLEWNFHSGVPLAEVALERGQVRFHGERAGLAMGVGSPAPLAAGTGQYAADGAVLAHNLVLTPRAPQGALQLAAILLPYPAGAVPPVVTVTGDATATRFLVPHAGGTDRIDCGWSPAGVSVRIGRDAAGRHEEIFRAEP